MKTKVIHAFLWILVCMVLGITCYQCRDLRGYVILSGSMEPVIPTGSVAVVDSSKRDVRPDKRGCKHRSGFRNHSGRKYTWNIPVLHSTSWIRIYVGKKSHVSYRRFSGAVHASGFLFSGEKT